MIIKNIFTLSGGITILSCSGYDPRISVVGKRFSVSHGNDVRQILKISGERKMLNQSSGLNQRAFETNEEVLLSQEEARSGEWQLINDQDSNP